jgi:ankyrin repeat protein
MAQAALSRDPAALLRQAAETGDIHGLQMLLEDRNGIDARDADGRTALMLAVLHRHSDAVDALLAHGADPNAADAHGTTPLQTAEATDQSAVAAALRRAGARAN